MRENRAVRTWVIGLLALLGISACQPPADDTARETGPAAFYDGRNIRWIIPYSPGGGYDEYARMLAPYLEKYTGARVDIVNLPGAGGMRGANELFNSRPDGLTIGLINGSGLVVSALAGISGADYDLNRFEYLGRIVADARVLVVGADSEYDSFAELLEAGSAARIGATGLGGSTYLDAIVMNEAFDGEIGIIHGFDSSSIIQQAMLRKNIAGTWGSWGSLLEPVSAGRQKVILQSGTARLAALPDVPTAFELAGTTADPEWTRAILNAWESLQAVGRPVAAPPETPPERVEFLANALSSALHDPELVATAERSRRMLHPATAGEMRRIVSAATNMPAKVRTLFVRAVKGEL